MLPKANGFCTGRIKTADFPLKPSAHTNFTLKEGPAANLKSNITLASCMATCRHDNLFSSLTEFYTLLVQLVALEPSQQLTFPDADAIANFPQEAALGAGYHPEVVELISRLPYLSVGISSISQRSSQAPF